MARTAAFHLLTSVEWRERQRVHHTRLNRWVDPHRKRASRGTRHPVADFLFSYYSFRPSALLRWHPGPGVMLGGTAADEFLRWPEYKKTADGVWLNPARIRPPRRPFLQWLEGFLRTTQLRPAFWGCHGWHEWAMVYQQQANEVRHRDHQLRVGPDRLAEIVQDGSGCCTHFDAFRFFPPAARALNRHQPRRESAVKLEQPGCLHVNMDLYKWAYKLTPCVPGELLASCFELAWHIREVDMRASPYELSDLGYAPIAIETAEGRAEYEDQQRGFTARAAPLRQQLRELVHVLSHPANTGTG